MGSTMNQQEQLPAALADVALLNAKAAAAVGSMSESWWHEEVRAGRAPKPVIRQPRCTRWRQVDVVDFWAARAAQGADAAKAQMLVGQAKRASNAAKAKRAALHGVAATA